MSYEIFSVAQFLVVDMYGEIAESDWPSPRLGKYGYCPISGSLSNILIGVGGWNVGYGM